MQKLLIFVLGIVLLLPVIVALGIVCYESPLLLLMVIGTIESAVMGYAIIVEVVAKK